MKKNVLAAILLGTALTTAAVTGCGASSSGTKTDAAAETTETTESETATEGTGTAVKPLYPLTSAEDVLADGGYSVSFTADDLAKTDTGYELTVEVYGYDSYDPADIDNLTAGSTIQFCNEDVTVDEIEKDSETGYITINGGVENNGIELTEEDGLYRTVTMDNYPVYYSIGKVTIPLADDVTFEDQVNPDGETDVPVVESNDLPDAIANSETSFNCTNTVITVRQEQIVQIIRYWVP